MGVVWTFFLSSIISLFFLPLSGRRPDVKAVKPKTTNQTIVGQGPTALAVGAGGVVWTFF